MKNSEAIGYMILAMERQGFSKDDINRVYDGMVYIFEEYTPEEAGEIGFKIYKEIKE